MRRESRKSVVAVAAALVAWTLIIGAVWQLEAQRRGLIVQSVAVGSTPVTYYAARDGAPAPLIVVAHGFAGSRQFMEAYSLSLAHAGYFVAAFDFEGHGRNPVPMSGDVTAIEGTTALLVAETLRVLEAGLARPESDGRAAILGHSMASDIVIRSAERDPRIGPVIAISPFSNAVTESHPQRLLMITGEWEPGLRDFALDAIRMVAPGAREGETVQSSDGEVIRRAIVAPNVEHVGVLYSRVGIAEAVAWLNAAFDRTLSPPVPMRIGWILALLAGIVILVWPLAALLSHRARPHGTDVGLSNSAFARALLVPIVVTPLVAVWVPSGLLPVLVADYLALHMLLYGALQLALMRFQGLRVTGLALGVGALLAAYGLLTFGMALDRYVASFVPHAGRIPIIAALALGALPYMLADSVMARAHPQLWRRVLIRLSFIASLGIAVALDFERLFFLLLIIPVIILFFVVFGLMGRWVGVYAGPLASGVGLGVLLAWSLGVTFPMFV